MTTFAKKTAVTAAGMTALYHAYGHPDVVLGIIPLYNAQMIEVTKSHQNLKYRAIGGQFLAHQRGGRYALRIDVKLPDTNDYLNLEDVDINLRVSSNTILSLLEMLHVYGGKMIKDNMDITKVNINNMGISGALTGESLTNAIDSGEVNLKGDYTAIKSDWHETFAIITKEEILFNMYIESIVYWRTNRNDDPSTINVSILCRKFVKPPEITELTSQVYSRLNPIKQKVINKEEIKLPNGQIKITRTIDTGDYREIRDRGDHYIVNQYDGMVDDWSPITYIVTKENRTPNNYEVVEMTANMIYRLTNLVTTKFSYENLRYRTTLYNSQTEVQSVDYENVINLDTGRSEEIIFDGFTEVDSISIDENGEGIGNNNTIYVYLTNQNTSGAGKRYKVIYINAVGFEKSYYLTVGNYYKVPINGIDYLFLPVEKGMRVWNNES